MITIRSVSKQDIMRAKPIILALTSVIFNTAAMVTGIKSTVEATRIIDKKREDGTLTTKEVIKDVAPRYLVPAACFVAGQITTFGSAVLSRDQSLALSAAATAANYRFNKYRSTVVKELGEDVDDHIVDIAFKPKEVARHCDFSYSVTPYGGPGETVIANMPEGPLLLFDIYRAGELRDDGSVDDGYFEIHKDQFLQGINVFSKHYYQDGHVDLNQLYEFWGIARTYGGDILAYDMCDGPEIIDIGVKPKDYDTYGNVLTYSIEYNWPPAEWPNEFQ